VLALRSGAPSGCLPKLRIREVRRGGLDRSAQVAEQSANRGPEDDQASDGKYSDESDDQPIFDEALSTAPAHIYHGAGVQQSACHTPLHHKA
jgi:hypothetical protein